MEQTQDKKPQRSGPPRRGQGRRPQRPRNRYHQKKPQRAYTPGPRPGRWVLPEKECDFLADGGFADALASAAAAGELSKNYRFRNIAGAGPAAIAAAFIAAAERGRTVANKGFKDLNSILRSLSDDAAFRREVTGLFQPDEATRKFTFILDAFLENPWRSFLKAVSFKAVSRFPLITLASLVPGLAVIAAALFSGNLVSMAVLLVIGVLLALVVPPLAGGHAALKGLGEALETNNYGLISGLAGSGSKGVSLIAWLSEKLNTLAAINDPRRLLTHGDLLMKDVRPDDEAGVNLELMAANITLQHSECFSVGCSRRERPEDMYFFDPDEMRKYFPGNVVDWLVKHARQQKNLRKQSNLVPLPEPKDLPVVFSLRLSIGVPFLFGLVPLYRIEREGNRREIQWRPVKCWFTGGEIFGGPGIDHFDEPIPVCPTFKCKVKTTPGSEKNGTGNLWVINRLNEKPDMIFHPLAGIAGLFSSLGRALCNQHDEKLFDLPGYIERIARIDIPEALNRKLIKGDGQAIAHVIRQGAQAGRLLVERFTRKGVKGNTFSWEGHRWIRFRVAMAQMETYFKRFRDAYYGTPGGEMTYAHMIMRGSDEPPDILRWKDSGQRNLALRVTAQLLDQIERWQQGAVTFNSQDLPETLSRLAAKPGR